MEKEDVEKIVWAGMLAPSADNCQPFRFEFKSDVLRIYYSEQRAQAFLDLNHIMSWLALGCMLTNIRIMARSLGYNYDVGLFPEDDENELVAILNFKKGPVYQSPLLPYLEKRCSNRRKAIKFAMPDKDAYALIESVTEKENVQVDITREKKKVKYLAKQLSMFYPLLLEHRKLHEGIYRWVRWNQKQAEKTKDGFNVSALEFSKIVEGLLRLSQAWSFSRLLSVLYLTKIVGFLIKRRYKHSSAFILLSINENKPDTHVKAGQELQRVWLEANRIGYSIHPSIGAISLALRVRLEKGEGMTASQIKLLKIIEKRIITVFPVFADRLPVFLLRVSKTEPPSNRTIRMPVSQVLTFSEE